MPDRHRSQSHAEKVDFFSSASSAAISCACGDKRWQYKKLSHFAKQVLHSFSSSMFVH